MKTFETPFHAHSTATFPRAARALSAVAAFLFANIIAVRAEPLPSASPLLPIFASGPFHEMETKYMFGFTDGADIGAEGEKAVELETTAGFGRRGGRYHAIEQELEFEQVLTQNFAYELSAHGLYNNIHNVEGMDNINRAAFGGLSAKFRYLLLGRGPESPFGLTFSFEPEWARVEGDTGMNTQLWGSTFKIVADTELIPNRLYAAVNLSYAPEVAKSPGATGWERASSLGVTGALSWRLTPRIAIGAEVEHYHAFDGLYFNHEVGHAWYVGPTLQINFTNKTLLALAFSTQVAGHAVADPRALDLTNFEKYHFNMKFEVEF